MTNLTLRTPILFPSQVIAGAGIRITKSGGVFTVAINPSDPMQAPTINGGIIDGATLATRLVKGIYILAARSTAVAYTGSTSEVTQDTIAVPAGVMGLNGRLRITAQYSFVGAVGTRTIRFKFGGQTFLQLTHGGAVLSARHQLELANRNNAALQIGQSLTQTDFASNAGALVVGTVNTAVSQNITLTMQQTSAGDTSTLEGHLIELIIPS